MKMTPDVIKCKSMMNAPSATLHGAIGAIHDGNFVVCGGYLNKNPDMPLKVSNSNNSN